MSELDRIKARIEEDRDTSEHCIDIDHADWLVSEIDRLREGLMRARDHDLTGYVDMADMANDYLNPKDEWDD